jgi:predicted transcriptional regulator
MRGVAASEETRALARTLHAEGVSPLEISRRLGYARATIYQWLDPEHMSKQKVRRLRYSQPCVDCGKATGGSGGFAAPALRCAPCQRRWQRENAIWTRETVITAIQAWADEHGGVPPVAADWNPAIARRLGKPEKADKFYEDDAWPTVESVQKVFGSWNQAIRAAGFAPRRPGHYGREGEDPTVVQHTVDLYEQGLSQREIAELLGISKAGVRYRLARGRGKRSTGAAA